MATNEFNFWAEMDDLIKATSKRVINKKVKDLKKFCLSKHNNFYPYRLALELERRGFSIDELEDYIIILATSAGSWNRNARYVVSLAANCKSANILKLQAAAIKMRNADILADFLCFVNTPDAALLQDLILDELKTPKSAATLLQYYKEVDFTRVRDVILNAPIRSASRYLYALGKKTTDPEEIKKIEELMVKNRSFFYMQLWVKHIKGANLQLFEDKVIASKNLEEIYKMFQSTGSKRLGRYCLLM